MSRLDEIEARLDAATTGPWSVSSIERGDLFIETPESRDAGEYPAAEVRTRSDAELIASAPEDLAALVAFARQVKVSVTSTWRAHDPNFDSIRDLLNDLEAS